MKSNIYIRLSIMMFLQFFIWGAWFVTMGTYLGTILNAEGGQIGQAYGVQSIGAIISPFIIGLIADRYFSAQRIMGVLHLIGAVLLFFAAQANGFGNFYPYILVYMILYMPTLALVNSISFNQMKDPSQQFSFVRIWGTIGWIVAGLLIGFAFSWEDNGQLQNTFLMAAAASLLLGVFSFTLPNTPPKGKNSNANISSILGLEALSLLKDKNFAIFFLSSILICVPLAFYYQNTNIFLNEIGMSNAAGIMTLGQVSEVLFMLLLPIFLKKYGIKWTLMVGMLSWVLRYVLFAYGDAGSGMWMLYMGILLHGVCYDFFFVSGQIYTDSKAGEESKNAAQGLIALATYGIGMYFGFILAGKIFDSYALAANGHDWFYIWIIPAGIAAAVALLFLLLFKNEKIVTE